MKAEAQGATVDEIRARLPVVLGDKRTWMLTLELDFYSCSSRPPSFTHPWKQDLSFPRFSFREWLSAPLWPLFPSCCWRPSQQLASSLRAVRCKKTSRAISLVTWAHFPTSPGCRERTAAAPVLEPFPIAVMQFSLEFSRVIEFRQCVHTLHPPPHTHKTACSQLDQVQSVRPGLCVRLIPKRKPLLFDGGRNLSAPQAEEPWPRVSVSLSPFLPLPPLSICLLPFSFPPPSLCLFSNT